MITPGMRIWLDALRSKNYQQTMGELTSVSAHDGSQQHCCLGVGCVLGLEHGIISDKYKREGSSNVAYFDGGFYQDSILGPLVQGWLGFPKSHGFTIFLHDERGIVAARDEEWELVEELELTTLNDEIGLTFEQIADLTEWYFTHNDV